MNPLSYARVEREDEAVAMATPTGAFYIAGGTNIVDLMKDDVERPTLLVDITALPLRAIETTAAGVRIGALATMADVADHPAIANGFPAVSQSLLLAASAQLRNAATIGGNVLQRTRCAYFRDVSQACNKRETGLGCAAIEGDNRRHAVIGASPHCICTHPSDLAVALMTADAVVHTFGPNGRRAIPFESFHVPPGDTPMRETVLDRAELVEAIEITTSAHAEHATYLKVRDRASYEFALVSVAAGLGIERGVVASARVAIGGVAPVPWRSRAAEAALVGKAPPRSTFASAASAAIDGMRGYGKNDFKIALTERSVVRALETVGGLA